MSRKESETQLSAPTSPIEPISEENSPNGQGKQRICPITEQAFHIRVGLMDITPSIRCPPVEPQQMTATATGVRMPYLTRNRAKVESPSPNTNHRVGDWLDESVLVLPMDKSTSQLKPMTRHEAEQCRTSTTSAEAEEPMPSTPFRQGNCSHKFKN